MRKHAEFNGFTLPYYLPCNGWVIIEEVMKSSLILILNMNYINDHFTLLQSFNLTNVLYDFEPFLNLNRCLCKKTISHKYSKKGTGDNVSVNVLTLLPQSVEYMMKGVCSNTVLLVV